jgi:tetratricopeptide (TPR) repeat protein
MAQMTGIKGFIPLLVAISVIASPALADDLRKQLPAKPISKERPAAAASAGETLAKREPEVRPGLAGSFLSGRFAKQNQDLKEAARFLTETLAHDPENAALQQETMRMQLLAGDIPAATVLARKLSANRVQGDPLVACLLMLERVQANDFVEAKRIIEQAPTAGLFGLIRPVMVEWIDVAANPRKSVVDMRASIEKAGFFAPFLNYHSALMNDVLGNKPAAAAAYMKANIDPAVTPYRVIEAIANFNTRQGKWDEAQALYDAYAKANPQSSLIAGRLVPAQTPKPLVGDAKQGLAELFFTTASILFGEDATQDTFLYLRIALELKPNLPPAQLMLANLYEQVEDYKQAVATYDTIPEGSVFYRRAQVRKALNHEALGQKDKAFSLLDKLADRYPDDASALITKGDMLRDAKEYDDAADAYSRAIERTQPLSTADWPLLYARGISRERAGDWDGAEADFLQALTLQPEQPDVLNYLAYSWLTMNKNILQAREYLEIASSQRPDDAHIIDSVGWAYYLAGDFPAAVAKFERAIELLPDDVTVNDHLGDAYWRVGRQTEARYQWERVLNFKPEQDVADTVRAKLESGLPDFVAPPPQVSAEAAKSARSKPDAKVQ